MTCPLASDLCPLDSDFADLEAEQEVLGALLVRPDAYDEAAAHLTPEDFFEPLHGRVFAWCAERTGAGQPVRASDLRAAFAADPTITELGAGLGYFANLIARAVNPANIAAPVATLKGLAIKRGLDQALLDARAHLTGDRKRSAVDLMDALDADLDMLRGRAAERMRAMDMEASYGAMEARLDRTLKGEILSVPTGLRELDGRLAGGMRGGNLIVLAARPGMGKTTLAWAIAKGAARAGHGVVFFELEMSSDEMLCRAASDAIHETGDFLPYECIAAGERHGAPLGEAELRLIARGRERIAGLPVIVDDGAGRSVPAIHAAVRLHARALEKKGRPLGLVVIDQLNRVRDSGAYRGNIVAETGEVVRDLKGLAMTLDVPVLLLCQLNREVDKRGESARRPKLPDLRESGRIEEEADTVLFAYRPEYYLENDKPDAGLEPEKYDRWIQKRDAVRNVLEVIVAKQRMGRTGVAFLRAFMGFSAVRDRAPEAMTEGCRPQAEELGR